MAMGTRAKWRAAIVSCAWAVVAIAIAATFVDPPAFAADAPAAVAAPAEPRIECAAFRAYPGPPGLRKMFQTLPDSPLTVVAATLVPASGAMPEYCKVEGYVATSVGFEVRMPTRDWNGRFLHQGCGAMCGSVSMASCEDALERHYATASTDMGHKSTAGDVKWARNNRQAQIDFGYRATHVATLAAKAIVQASTTAAPAVVRLLSRLLDRWPAGDGRSTALSRRLRRHHRRRTAARRDRRCACCT